VTLLTQTQSDRLGYAIDSRFYGISEFGGYCKAALEKLAVEKVNEAIRKHLRSTDLDVVIITKDARGMRQAIRSAKPAAIIYASPPPKEVLEEDKLIGKYPIDAGSVEIVPVDAIFER
jgi:zinc protease